MIFAGAARAVLWAQIDDARAQRVARQYVEPLATWCVVVVATHALALGAAGGADMLSLALPLSVAAAAVLLRSAGETGTRSAANRASEAEAEEQPPAATGTATPPPAPAASLWANPADEESTRQGALWSR